MFLFNELGLYKKMFPKIMFKETSITVFKWKTEGIPVKEKLALYRATGSNAEQFQLNVKKKEKEQDTKTKHICQFKKC